MRLIGLIQAENKNEAPQYDGTWRDADPAEVKAKMDAGVTYTYRFKVPKGKVSLILVSLGVVQSLLSCGNQVSTTIWCLFRAAKSKESTFCICRNPYREGSY